MKQSKIVLLLIVVLFGSVKAQSNLGKFVPGYIVKLTGDTLRGQIKVYNEFRAPLSVKFKSGDGKAVTYKPLAIKAYYRDGEYYSAKKTSARNIFMLRLVSGEVSLYVFKKKQRAPVPVGAYTTVVSWDSFDYYVERGATFTEVKKGNFVKVMSDLLSDNSELIKGVQNSDYTMKNIEILIKLYNGDFREKNK